MKIDIDLSDANLQTRAPALPSGQYVLDVTKAEPFKTKSGHTALKLIFSVKDGPLKGRAYSNILNINHSNETAVKIAKDELFTIMTLGGHKNPKALKDTDELLGLSVGVILEEVEEDFQNERGEVHKTKKNKVVAWLEPQGVDSTVVAEPMAEVAEMKEETKSEEVAMPWG